MGKEIKVGSTGNFEQKQRSIKKKEMRNGIILSLFLLICSAAWCAEVKWVNKFYAQNSTERTQKEYAIGDMIPVEENEYALKRIAPSCCVTVDSYEVIDYDEFIKTYHFTGKETEKGNSFSKLLLVTVSVSAEAEETMVMNEFVCYGVDALFRQDWNLLQQINECLNETMYLTFEEGDTYLVTLPFVLQEEYLTAAWNRIEDYPVWLRLTIRPEEIVVRIQ